MATTRARQLEKLASKLPGANQKVQQGLDEARQTQLQETIRQAQPSAGTRAAQQIGQQQTAQAGQARLAGAQQLGQQATQLGQLGLQQQARGQREAAVGQQLSLNQHQADQAAKLNSIDANLKNQLLDSQMTFQRDAAGQALFNHRQLFDWAVTKSESAQELAAYKQAAEQVNKRKIQLYKRSHQLLKQKLDETSTLDSREMTSTRRKELQQQANAMEIAISEEKARAANAKAKSDAMWDMASTVAVAGITAYNPAAGAVAAAVVPATVKGIRAAVE